MKTLVLGASGATGKHLVQQLIHMETKVKAVLRSPDRTPSVWKEHPQIELIYGQVSAMATNEMSDYLKDCDAVASCLGHNLNLKGIYGKPRKLVRDAMRLTCQAIQYNKPVKPVKVVLMNTTGNQNRDLMEKRSFGEKLVVGLLRVLLPPQADNESAAEVLRNEIGQEHPFVEWVAVRPDGLINEDSVTPYSQHPSPLRSPIFNAGKTSRINVGHFMATLITNQETWNKWKGQMPVIYNTSKNE